MNELVFIFCDCSSVVDSVDMQFRTSLDIYNLSTTYFRMSEISISQLK